VPTDPSLPATDPLSPSVVGTGLELTPEQWENQIFLPLQNASAIMSLPGAVVHSGYGPIHLPKMSAEPLDDSAWVGPNQPVAEVNMDTSGSAVLLARGVKALKVIPRLSSETVQSSVDGPLNAAHSAIIIEMIKRIDPALISGSAAAGITGLIAQAGSSTAFDSTVSEIGIEFDFLQDLMTLALDNWARPDSWLMNTRTLGRLHTRKDSLGRPLLTPNYLVRQNTAGEGTVVTETLMGLPVYAAPSVPLGTVMLIDEDQVHIGRDRDAEMRILMEAFVHYDQIGFLIKSRWDIGLVNPFGVVVLTGLGPDAT
jgi:HK97 family phage major capsid protein